MKKRIFAAALVFAVCGTAFAQAEQNADVTETVEYSADKYKVETNRFWSNWFISVGAGGQIYFGDHDKQADFGDRISPALDIAVGKWFTPGIGLRLMYSGLSVKGATKWNNDPNYDSSHGTGEVLDGSHPDLQKQKFNFWNIHGDVMFNLSSLLCGYKEKRVYSFIPYVGIGAASATKNPKNVDITGHVGILNTFRISPAFDINLDLRGMFVNDDFDGEVGGRGGEGMFTATVGLTYKIKPRGWNRSKTVTRMVYNNDEINAMRERINRLSEENARLQQALEQGRQDEAQAIVKQIASANLVTFKINKSDLSNEARVNLGMLAEVIKQGEPSAVYTITGYADAGTGSKKGNEKLSKARAEAVYDCLVNEFGVDKSQLEVDYKGGVENMFYDDPRLSRAVITRGN